MAIEMTPVVEGQRLSNPDAPLNHFYSALWEKSPFPMAVIRLCPDGSHPLVELVDANPAFEKITALVVPHRTRESLVELFWEWFPEFLDRLAKALSSECLPDTCMISTGKGNTLRRYDARFSALGNHLVLLSFSPQVPEKGSEDVPKQYGQVMPGHGVLSALEQKESIEDIKREEALQGIFDAISSGILLMDEAGKITLFNRGMTRLFGYSEDELSGMHYTRLICPKDRCRAWHRTRCLIDSERVTASGDRRYRRADGSEFYGYVTGRRLLYSDGSFWGLLSVITDITQQKAIQAALHRSESRLQTLINTIPDIVALKDCQGRILSCNKSFELFWDERECNLVGKSVFDLTDYDLAAVASKNDRKVVDRQKTVVAEETLVSKTTGRRGVFETIKTPMYDAEENLVGVLCVARDITRRIKSQKALKDSEARYRELFENMASGVAVLAVDRDGRHFEVKEFNPAAERITGRKRGEILGRKALTVFSGFLHSDLAAVVLEAWRTGKRQFLPVSEYKDDVLQLWLSVNVYRLPSREVVVVFNDSTEKKRIEQALEFQHGILRSVVNSIGDCLLIINRDFKIEFQNEVSRQALGDLRNRTCYLGIFKRKSPCRHCRISPCLKQNRLAHTEVETSDKKNLELTFSPLQDSGRRDKVVVLMRDVTEKTKLRAETMRAGHLASIGELAAGVAHEINNPVTGIISIAEILSDQIEVLGGDRAIPNRIINEGERISKIVKNLLSFARVQNEDNHPVPVGKVIDGTLNLVERWLRKDGIHLSFDLAPDLPLILANEQEMQQVFLNLFSNARHALNVKYPGSGDKKRIWVIARKGRDDTMVRISVVDNGTGIPEKILHSVTAPFFTTKPQGEGTGLGLSISHGIIKNHQGHLSFDSVDGAFTRVIIDLPAVGAAPESYDESRRD